MPKSNANTVTSTKFPAIRLVSWRKHPRFKLIGKLTIVAVAFLIFFAVVLHQKNKPHTPLITYTTLLQQTNNKINNYLNQKKYTQAVNYINAQKNIYSIDKNMMLATIYQASGNLTDSLNIYAKIDQEGQMNYSAAASAAAVATSAQSYALAIKYYDLAISLAPVNDPTAQSDIAYFQSQINSLNSHVGR